MAHFVPIQHLTIEQRRKICALAKEECRRWWVDKLDCSVSIARQLVEMSFEDIMAKLDERCHFVIIHRNTWGDDYLEIGFSTIGKEPAYFLWIILDPEYLDWAKLEELGYVRR